MYVSETWVTKQLLPDLQAVCAVTFSGEKVVFYFFNMDYGRLRQRCGIKLSKVHNLIRVKDFESLLL